MDVILTVVAGRKSVAMGRRLAVLFFDCSQGSIVVKQRLTIPLLRLLPREMDVVSTVVAGNQTSHENERKPSYGRSHSLKLTGSRARGEAAMTGRDWKTIDVPEDRPELQDGRM